MRLTSGRRAYHEGVETREDFEYDEFISKLLELSDGGEAPLGTRTCGLRIMRNLVPGGIGSSAIEVVSDVSLCSA
ncbi:hypothetical protein [Micromonospora sp. DT47]|uniref:hypothetical protein n=1 Tax=Micromonospora sp. DT47 TaxID=3393431 RepID=UPI003CEDC566